MTTREGHRSVHRYVWRLACAALLCGATVARGGPVPNALLRFELPLTSVSGVAGELVSPSGTPSKLVFESGKVAIGEVMAALPERALPRRRGHAGQRATTSPPVGPRARLVLAGVTDGDGNLVTNSGNQLVIDALVSPSTAAPSGQPFTFPFDIIGGSGFVDAALPIDTPPDGPVRLQVIGISVEDPEGQPFAVLGFEVAAQRPTAPPSVTPSAIPTIVPEGWCFHGSSCGGGSVPSSQEDCCRPAFAPGASMGLAASWCASDQFDAVTGQCSAEGCQVCTPPPTPTPGPCANLAACGGGCTLTCADGTTVGGQCMPDASGACQCSALCAAPTPCGVGECFDPVTDICTGRPCDARLHCPLANEVCDVGGQRCPCQPAPPLPQGHICCQCKDQAPACIDFSYVEVQPICPPGCEAFMGQECDTAGASCVPLAPCATDQDCDDGNACTADRCTASGCTHDCVCVGPAGCGPGPGSRPH